MIKIAIVEDDIKEQERISSYIDKLEEEMQTKMFVKIFILSFLSRGFVCLSLFERFNRP